MCRFYLPSLFASLIAGLVLALFGLASFLNSLSVKAFVPKQGIKKPLSMSDYVIDLNFDILEGANTICNRLF
jgi:hypothetical protein